MGTEAGRHGPDARRRRREMDRRTGFAHPTVVAALVFHEGAVGDHLRMIGNVGQRGDARARHIVGDHRRHHRLRRVRRHELPESGLPEAEVGHAKGRSGQQGIGDPLRVSDGVCHPAELPIGEDRHRDEPVGRSRQGVGLSNHRSRADAISVEKGQAHHGVGPQERQRGVDHGDMEVLSDDLAGQAMVALAGKEGR